jgi:hypothetical protein
VGFAVAATAEIDAEARADLSLQVASGSRLTDTAAGREDGGAHGE